MILSGLVAPVCLAHDHNLLAEYARILKPLGLLIIKEPTVDQGTLEGYDSECTIKVLY